MTNDLLKSTDDGVQFSRRFFQSAIESQHLSHAYILKGGNLSESYQLALDIAKVLNCRAEDKSSALVNQDNDCLCNSCRWLKDNAHPGVLTISRLTYWVSDSGEELDEEGIHKLRKSKKTLPKQISTHQIARLINRIQVSSEYHRVVIFMDADVVPEETEQKETEAVEKQEPEKKEIVLEEDDPLIIEKERLKE